MPIYALSYHSRNRLQDTALDTRSGLDEILRVARSRNKHLGITGALMFNEGRFVQLLEGEEAAVREVFASVSTDKRHSDITVLSVETRMARRFDSWAMAFVGQSACAKKYYSDYTNHAEFSWSKITDDALGRLILRMMESDRRA